MNLPHRFLSTPERTALARRLTFTLAPREAYGSDDKCFAVTIAGIVIGRVYAAEETIERRAPGRRYVSDRWQRPCWRYEPERPHRERRAWRFAYPSRVQAAADLVSFAIEDGGALGGTAGAVLVADVQRETAGAPLVARRRGR